MAWNDYYMACRNIIKWNTSIALPVCTEACKRSINELVMNPIGRQLKCCRCDDDDSDDDDDDDDGVECTSEKKNIGLFCGVDFNNAKECQNDRRMCDNMRGNSTNRPGMREMDCSPEEERKQNQRGQGQGQERPNQFNRNQECDRDQRPTNRDFDREQRGKICCAKLILCSAKFNLRLYIFLL